MPHGIGSSIAGNVDLGPVVRVDLTFPIHAARNDLTKVNGRGRDRDMTPRVTGSSFTATDLTKSK